jgi:hypothetical protein
MIYLKNKINMKKINIGITINIKQDGSLWNSGIIQNVINFYLLLKNSPNDYNIFIVNVSQYTKLESNFEDIKIDQINDIKSYLDIIFVLGGSLSVEDYNYLKKKGCKIIDYNCGVNYVFDVQKILFNSKYNSDFLTNIPDEIWYLPHHNNLQKNYLRTIQRRKSKEAPFVWSPIFIDNTIKQYNIKCFYEPVEGSKRISCFEPNIDVVKFCMYDILIVEELYRISPELIKHFYITNTTEIRKNELFIKIMKTLDIVKDNKATFEDRFRMPYFLDKFTDIVIAHQWESSLNYAYFDALYLNYPFVHNAPMIKDSGYYYDQFNVEEGVKQLKFAIEQHDKNIEEYNERNKKVIDRFLPNNEKIIEIYDEMIDDLFKK